jgi:RNA polymerase sigma-70 factor, ECF subfamily
MTASIDDGTWPELAERLRPFVARRVASEADADDVLQDVLMRMHRGLPSLADEERLAAWMFRIARTAIADHLRQRARHPVAAPSEEPPGEVDEPPDSDEAARIVARSLSLFVSLLPSPYREAITLVELEGRTHKQAAEMLGISVSGMKSRVQRGRAKLRTMLELCCEIAVDARGRVIACEPRKHGAPPDCDC